MLRDNISSKRQATHLFYNLILCWNSPLLKSCKALRTHSSSAETKQTPVPLRAFGSERIRAPSSEYFWLRHGAAKGWLKGFLLLAGSCSINSGHRQEHRLYRSLWGRGNHWGTSWASFLAKHSAVRPLPWDSTPNSGPAFVAFPAHGCRYYVGIIKGLCYQCF